MDNVIIEELSLNDVDKIKEFKELLDSGVITQEEFETKKKQLLNDDEAFCYLEYINKKECI